MSDVERDLYKLVGNYERFSEDVIGRLEKIDERLTSGNRNFDQLHKLCATRGKDIEHLDGRIGNLENRASNELSRKRRLQIDISSIITAIIAAWEIIKSLF